MGKGSKSRYWLCKCACGVIKEVFSGNIIKGSSKSCGKCGSHRTPPNKLDLTGQRFGRLTVLHYSYLHNGKKSMWICRCDCGKEYAVRAMDLRRGATKSCGCWHKEFKFKDKGVATLQGVYATYRNSARIRGLEFNLPKDAFERLILKNCHYCGAPPSNLYKSRYGNGDCAYNGIDRLDNSKGYTLKNIVPCCKTCNIAKRDSTIDEFMAWIRRIQLHQLREVA